MDSISERVYKDFEPSWDWVPEEDCDTLLLYLPGFKKEQLKVQLSRTKNLIISGERQLEDNTWSRFRKQFAISNNCDLNGISARFDAGVLYVRQPKLIMPAEKQEEEKPTITEPPKPQKPMEEPQPQKNEKEHATGPQATSMANLAEPKIVKKNDELEATKSVSKKGGEEEREMEKKKGKESESSSDSKSSSSDSKSSSSDSKSSQEQVETNAKSKDRKYLKEENEGDKIARDGMEKSGRGTGDGAESGKTRVEKYRLGVGPAATEVKKLPKVMNMALAVLVVIVLGIYIVNAFRSPVKAEK